MSGFILFVVLVVLILIGGYFKAKKEANSTPLKRSFNRAASLWNQADPKHRAMMLASVGVLEHTPSFSVYLVSTWNQLDLNLCALLAATIDEMRAHPPIPKGTESLSDVAAPSSERNPALDELKLLPQNAITAGLIAAMPSLAAELYGEAEKQANALGISDPVFTDCIFDLELVGAFEKAMIFTSDKNLASLFIDAMIFKATRKSPSVPSDADISAGVTSQHRGLSKYALARKHFLVRDPTALLFGREFARAKGKELNRADVDAGVIAALYIRQAGAWAANVALTGKSPTREEIDALPEAIDEIGKAELFKSNAAFDPIGSDREGKPTPKADNFSISFQPVTDEQEQDYFNRHWRRLDHKILDPDEKKLESPRIEKKFPTKGQMPQEKLEIELPTQKEVEEPWDRQTDRLLATQMFEPPITGRAMIAGRPVLRIPNSEKKYPNFLAWWTSVGRLNPRDAQGWSTLSGPGVMRDRAEIIEPKEWAALPEEERELITTWVRTWPIGMFFD